MPSVRLATPSLEKAAPEGTAREPPPGSHRKERGAVSPPPIRPPSCLSVATPASSMQRAVGAGREGTPAVAAGSRRCRSTCRRWAAARTESGGGRRRKGAAAMSGESWARDLLRPAGLHGGGFVRWGGHSAWRQKQQQGALLMAEREDEDGKQEVVTMCSAWRGPARRRRRHGFLAGSALSNSALQQPWTSTIVGSGEFHGRDDKLILLAVSSRSVCGLQPEVFKGVKRYLCSQI